MKSVLQMEIEIKGPFQGRGFANHWYAPTVRLQIGTRHSGAWSGIRQTDVAARMRTAR